MGFIFPGHVVALPTTQTLERRLKRHRIAASSSSGPRSSPSAHSAKRQRPYVASRSSLVDLPEEIVQMIFSFADLASLQNFAVLSKEVRHMVRPTAHLRALVVSRSLHWSDGALCLPTELLNYKFVSKELLEQVAFDAFDTSCVDVSAIAFPMSQANVELLHFAHSKGLTINRVDPLLSRLLANRDLDDLAKCVEMLLDCAAEPLSQPEPFFEALDRAQYGVAQLLLNRCHADYVRDIEADAWSYARQSSDTAIIPLLMENGFQMSL